MTRLGNEAAAGPTAGAPVPGDRWRPILPVPNGVSLEIPGAPRSAPAQLWRYKDASGGLLGAVCRWDTPKGKKILPLTYCEGVDGERKWRFKQFPQPRPLYRLNDLFGRPAASVLVCEGEKSADAAAEMFPDIAATTSPAGSKAADKADWSPLAGRDVLIWPDNDEPGTAYGKAVAELAAGAGARSVRVVGVPAGFPERWDLADPLAEGVTTATLRALLDAAQPPVLADAPALTSSRSGRGQGPYRGGLRQDLLDIADATATYLARSGRHAFCLDPG